MARFVLFLALVALVASANAGKATKCPKVLGKYPFDETKFNGDWYIISGADPKLEGARCAKINMNFAKSTDAKSEISEMAGTFRAIGADNKPLHYESVMQSFKSEKSALSMSVFKKEGAPEWSGIYKSSIVATDYENYAVVVSCKPTFDASTKSFGRTLTAKILARSKVLSKDTLYTLTNLISGYDIDTKTMRTIDHTKCDAILQTPVHHTSTGQQAAYAAGKH